MFQVALKGDEQGTKIPQCLVNNVWDSHPRKCESLCNSGTVQILFRSYKKITFWKRHIDARAKCGLPSYACP